MFAELYFNCLFQMIRIISKLIILPVFFSTLVSCKTEVIIPVERNYKQIFSDSSFWNRPIMPDAQYSDIQDVLMNIPEQAPTRLFMETVAFLIVNPTAPLVNIKSSQGFEYPFRTQEKGSTMAQFHLESDAGVTECNAKGNGHFGIYDTNTGTIYQGCAMWRNQGSNTLLSAHVSDRFNTNITSGDGTKGYRAAGFSALGGVLLSGEMNNGIKHCLSVLVNARQLYANQFFTWPATSADGHAPDPVTGYQGTNPNYKMGSLLAIPKSVNLNQYSWKTMQGRIFADCAQSFGYYVCDDIGTLDSFGFVLDYSANDDIGLVTDKYTGFQKIDASKLKYDAFWTDIHQILTLLKSVSNNHP